MLPERLIEMEIIYNAKEFGKNIFRKIFSWIRDRFWEQDW